MWQCLSTIMMKKIGNLQISFMSSALVKKDVYYNRAKKKKKELVLEGSQTWRDSVASR